VKAPALMRWDEEKSEEAIADRDLTGQIPPGPRLLNLASPFLYDHRRKRLKFLNLMEMGFCRGVRMFYKAGRFLCLTA
jgi:hypothetical protein